MKKQRHVYYMKIFIHAFSSFIFFLNIIDTTGNFGKMIQASYVYTFQFKILFIVVYLFSFPHMHCQFHIKYFFYIIFKYICVCITVYLLTTHHISFFDSALNTTSYYIRFDQYIWKCLFR